MSEKFPVLSEGGLLYDDLGYYVAYKVHEYWLEVSVYEAGRWTDGGLWYRTDDCRETEKIEEAEVVVSGSVKWDGCSNWDFHTDECMAHFCDRKGLTDFGELLGRLWDLAADKVPASICEGEYKR